MKNWISVAQWPEGTLGFDDDISRDGHESEEAAQLVCRLLSKEGFGGQRKIFPVKTWVDTKEPDPKSHEEIFRELIEEHFGGNDPRIKKGYGKRPKKARRKKNKSARKARKKNRR